MNIKSILIGIILSIFLLGGCSTRENKNLSISINENPQGNVQLIATAPNNEGFAMIKQNENPIFVFVLSDKRKGQITFNEKGLPDTMTFEGTTATFKNHTDKTVDIFVTRADGSKEEFKNSPISPLSKISFFPQAHAQNSSQYLSMAGTAINTVSCGVGLGTILFSGGASSPLAYLGCGALTTRVATLETQIGDCQGDILNCAMEKIMSASSDITAKQGPDFLKKGLQIKGTISNAITKTPIQTGVIINKKIHGDWKESGQYDIHIKDHGAYGFKLSALGYKESSLNIFVTNTKIQIHIPQTGTVLEKIIENENFVEIPLDIYIEPEAYIRGEVIDITNGNSLSGATIKLWNGEKKMGSDETLQDGTFVINPMLLPQGGIMEIEVSKKGYRAKKLPITLSYEVKKNDDNYFIPEFTEIIKLEEQTGEWELSLSNPEKEIDYCSNELIGYFKKIKVDITENIITGLPIDENCQGEKECSRWPITGKIENGTFSAEMEIPISLFGTSKHVLTGTINETTGSGTWERPVPEGVSRGERHHYEGCKGTWTIIELANHS